MSKEPLAAAYERFPELLAFHRRFRSIARRYGYEAADELAEALGASTRTVVRWQTGMALPNAVGLMSISRLLGAPIDWLCGNTEVYRHKRPTAGAVEAGPDT